MTEKPIRKRKSLAETKITGPMAERVTANGRRRLQLSQGERKALARNQKIESVVALFLDLQGNHTWEEIAREVGLSIMGLKDLTKSDEFIAVYNQHFVELGHDPRLRASQAAIVDLLPAAVNELKTMLVSAETPASVKFNAIKEILKLNGIEGSKAGQNDKQEVAEFLKKLGTTTINNVNVNMPAEYADKITQYVEGEYVESSLSVDQEEPGI
jgi:hypothetical protein